MKITFVLPHGGLAGGVRVIAIYARALHERGHHVEIVHGHEPTGGWRDAVRQLVRGRLPARPPRGPSHLDGLPLPVREVDLASGRLERALPDADLIIASWWETAELVGRLPPRKGKHVYFVQHDETVFYPTDAAMRERVTATLRQPMHRIAVAGWIPEVARHRGVVGPFAIVPNGVDTDRFSTPPRGKQNTPTVGMMYGMIHAKGSDVGFAAVERARREVPTLRFVCFAMEEPAIPMPAGTEFHLRPAQDVIPKLYASTDAWLFTSRSEGFGLPVLEAMACRTPVIGTRAGVAPDVVSEGGGVLIDIDDADAMARAIVEFARLSEPQWQERSAQARRLAERHTWAASIDQFERELLLAAGARAEVGVA